eukprot:870154-Alexandrium_andersonii.AAC.1
MVCSAAMLVRILNPAWHLYIERRPTCNPQSAQGPSAPQSVPIRNPPSGTCNIAANLVEVRGPRNDPKIGPRISRGARSAPLSPRTPTHGNESKAWG